MGSPLHNDPPSTKVKMSEEKLSGVWDRCIADAAVKTGTGAAFGSLLSLVLFKRKLWPITFGLGTGFGIGYSNCQHMVKCSVVFFAPSISSCHYQAISQTME